MPMLEFVRKEKVTPLDENKREIDDAIKYASECLRNEAFIKYRKAYELAESRIIARMIAYDQVEQDPMKYGFGMKDLVAAVEV